MVFSSSSELKTAESIMLEGTASCLKGGEGLERSHYRSESNQCDSVIQMFRKQRTSKVEWCSCKYQESLDSPKVAHRICTTTGS